MEDITVFSIVGEDAQNAIQMLRKNNIGVVIHNESRLNAICSAGIGKENVAPNVDKGKGKEKESSQVPHTQHNNGNDKGKGKEKANVAPIRASWMGKGNVSFGACRSRGRIYSVSHQTSLASSLPHQC